MDMMETSPAAAGAPLLREGNAIRVESLWRCLAFLSNVLDAETIACEHDATGRMRRADIRLGQSRLELRGDAGPLLPAPMLRASVPDAARTFARAVAGGAAPLRAPERLKTGRCEAWVQDAGGVIWQLVSPADGMARPGNLPDARIERVC